MPINPHYSIGDCSTVSEWVLPNWVRRDCPCDSCTAYQSFRRDIDRAISGNAGVRIRGLTATYRQDDVDKAMQIVMSSDFTPDKYDRTMNRQNISTVVKECVESIYVRFLFQLSNFDDTVAHLCRVCGAHHSTVHPSTEALLNSCNTPAMIEFFENPGNTPHFCDRCWSTGLISHCPDCHRFGFDRLFDEDDDDPEVNAFIVFPRHRFGGYGTVHLCNDCEGTVSNQTNSTPDAVECVACHRSMAHDSNAFMYSISCRDGHRLCEDCSNIGTHHFTCAHCGYRYSELTERHLVAGTGTMCHRCYTNTGPYDRCENCGSEYAGNAPWHCSCNNIDIHNYTYKPTPEWWYDNLRERRRNATFYGVELEFSPTFASPSGNAASIGYVLKKVPNGTDLFYVKNDASTHNGFEVVSHPFTWQWMNQKPQQAMMEMFFELLVGKLGYTGANQYCGMHVHISRKGFCASTLYKLMRLVYGYPLFTEKVAGRTVGEMGRYTTLNFGGAKELADFSKEYNRAISSLRGAVNLNNRDTIELRIFRGVDSADVFYRNLEYLEAFRSYVAECSMADANPFKFREWIFEKHKKNRMFPRVANHIGTFIL